MEEEFNEIKRKLREIINLQDELYNGFPVWLYKKRREEIFQEIDELYGKIKLQGYEFNFHFQIILDILKNSERNYCDLFYDVDKIELIKK
jgi:hypothetical protein